ncbi:roundabout homolog 1 isoform X5 [Nematostella vectensis]|uniref:roundabout homolog 1 isoform X5 n=1 Tax=Nematostella vectensis TaxID=45351 RepID=UPI0020770A78|nr:roundabout homolog 1 isoform X5 [Nematostella vectensis]
MNHRVFVASLMISAVLPFATATLTFTVQPADAVVVVGQSLMLNCQATDSTGTPVTINWKKGSDWLVDPTNKPWRQLRNNSLYYTSIAAQDVGEFLCGAVSGGSAIIYSRTVTVELASISSIFVSNPNNRTKRVGDADTHFACVTGISKPFASVYWEKDGVKLTEYPTTSMLIPTDNPSWTSASISVRNITLKSAGFYRCVAVNPMLPNLPQISQPAYLQVLPAIDAPHFQVHPSSTTIAEHQSAALQCHILGVPTPSVTWEFNSNGLLDSPDRYQLSNGSLYFKSANRTMAGVYKCTGTNSVGSVSSSPVFVGVAYFDFVFHKHPSSQNVTEGAPVSLECDPPNSYPIGVTITWFRNYQAVQLGSGITVSSSGTLTFAAAKKADEGEYFCSGVNSYLKASRSSSIAQLTVWVRPTFSTKPQNTTVIEHQSLLLICAATGYPMPSVLWLKDNQAVDTNHVTLHSNGSLSITRVLFSDRGSYSCVATNVAGSASSVATLTVQVPPTVSGRPTNATRIVGESHTVTCQFQGSPAPLVTWFFKNDTADKTVPSTLNYVINGGILTIKAVTKSDEGTFVCKGTNPAGAAEASAYLYVKVPVSLDAGPVNVTVNETSTASFECQASGDPTPTVTWYRGQTALTHGGRYVIGQGTLTILRSNPSDTGEYRCNVTNGLATHVGVAHLFVQVPAAITSLTAPRFAQLNGSTTLICLTSGIPSPRITWYRDGRVVTPDGSRVTINGGSLSIARVTRSDGGTYACAASNAAGMTSRAANLTIQVPPGPPTDVSALPLTSTSIKLSWKPAFNGHSPVTSYTIEQRVGDRYQEIASGVTMTAYTVSGLSPYVEYTFRLRAMNAIGLGEGGLVSNTTMEDAPSEPRNVAVTSLNSTTITVTWSAPATPNGIITWYGITYMVKGGSSSSQQFPVSGLPQLRAVISNLLPHRLYVVRVRAATGSGAKMWGNFSSEAEGMTGEDTPSAPPQAVRVRASNATAIHVTWQAVPASSTNGIVRGYQILYQAVGPFHYGSPMTMTSLTMNASLDGLHPWTDYQVSVQAFTVGAGPASPGIIVRTHESVPSGPPLNVTLVTADANSINVSMATPAPKMRNGNITGFRVYYNESNSSGPFFTVTTDSMETRLVNLTTYMEYAVSVAAMTTSGEGVRSQAMTVRTGEGVPGEVRDVTLEDKTHVSVKVTWNPPQPSTGIIQEYRIVYNTSEGGLKSKTTSDTSVVLTNMVPNTTYALWVVAKTSAGYGPRGNTLYLTTGLPPVPSTSAPHAPTTATPNATKSPAVGSGPSSSRLLSERDLIIVVSCIGVIVILLILLAVYFIVIRPRNSYKGQMSGTERKRRQGAIDMENLRGSVEVTGVYNQLTDSYISQELLHY